MLWTVSGAVLLSYLINIPERVTIIVHLVALVLMGGRLTARFGAVALRIFLVVFPVVVLATLCLYSVYLDRYGSPYYIGGSDDLAYERSGQLVAESLGPFDYEGIRGNIVQRTHNSVGYVFFVSLLHRSSRALTGFHTLIPRLVNAAALAVLASFTYALARRHHLSSRIAAAAGLYTGLAPIMTYTAAHTFRDTLTSLITMAIVLQWSGEGPRRGFRGRVGRWIVSAAGVLVLTQLRQYQAVAVLGIIASAVVASPRWPLRDARMVQGRRYLALLMAAAAGVVIFVSPLGQSLWARLLASVSGYSTYRASMADGLSRLVFEAPMPLGAALRTLYALVTPLPVLSGEIDRIWLSVGTVVQVIMLPYLIAGLVTTLRSRWWWSTITAFVLLFLGMAMVSFTSRHIVQWVPYAAVIAACGYSTSNRSSRAVYVLSSTACGILLGVLYLIAKG